MHAGYPDTPEKPELVKQAEQLTVKNWDFVQEIWPQLGSEKSFANLLRDMEANNCVFRSDEEKEEYWKCAVAIHAISAVASHAQAKGQISNAREIREAYTEYLQEDYLKKKRGIRVYSLRSPKDREILGVGGRVNPK
jgi:hypothetical protein